MSDLSKLTELRKLMLDMERSIGLQELSSVERDIYYAASDLESIPNGVKTNTLLEHSLVTDVSRPTFFRALKSLVVKGYLAQSHAEGRGQYFVVPPK